MCPKIRYRAVWMKCAGIPLFNRPYWLDAVCGVDGWDVILHEDKEGCVDAAWPYHFIRGRKGLIIKQPRLTQFNGIWFKPHDSWPEARRLEWEKAVVNEMVDALESRGIARYKQHFSTAFTNWLPLFWRGYRQTTRYTYRINGIRNSDDLIMRFTAGKRCNIRHATREGVEVRFDFGCERFYEYYSNSLKKQGAEISYPFDLFKSIHDAVYANGSGRTMYAIDKTGNVHGAILNVWDDEAAYDLITAYDPDYRNSGASGLLIYEMIKYVSQFVDIYDFEGSMEENIEKSYRQFATHQTPYFCIEKDNSAPWRQAAKLLWNQRDRLFRW